MCSNREIHIYSYFSLPTDLAGEMQDWPEFIAGHNYSVDLKSCDREETVSVRNVVDGEDHFVSLSGCGAGPLFDRVLGRVIYALIAHSDNLMVHRGSGNV
jgi:hypothetical protein